MALSDLAVVMSDGRIAQAGPPREVFDRPRTPFVARFIGGHNVLEEGGRATALRADAVRIERDPAAGRPARVREVEYRGSDVLVSLATEGGEEMAAILPDRDFYARPFEPGEAVGLTWRPEDAHALAPDP